MQTRPSTRPLERRPLSRRPPARVRAPRERGFFLAVAAAALTAQVGFAMIGIGYGYGADRPPAPRAVTASGATGEETGRVLTADGLDIPAPAAGAAGGRGGLPYSVPVRLRIPRVGIDTTLMTLGLNADQTVQVPPGEKDAPAGWYRNLAAPGQIGPAVLLGHVDATGGAAVFYPLGSTRAGDRIEVRRADGRTVAFTVDKVASYPRAQFPTEAVYGETAVPVLRLITCGGQYDRQRGGYQENVVVFASLATA